MEHKESGVLLHITSLPGKYGVGKIGKEARKFIDYIKECGFSYWEILPINDTGYMNSPFLPTSAFGHNYLLIDYDELIEDKLLTPRYLYGYNFGEDPHKVDFINLNIINNEILLKAYKRFNKDNDGFKSLKNNNFIYLFALYKVIKNHNSNNAWFNYSLEDRYYSKEVREHYERHYKNEIDFYIFLEYIFQKQWKKLHSYAKKNNIDLIGDIPHFLGYDSDALYFNPELFLVDKRNLVTYVAGFPPDNFSPQGQKWGYPIYDWQYMAINNYKWRESRVGDSFKFFDRVKLNHIRGFYKVYAIPFRAKSAKKGEYIEGPKFDFFNIIKNYGNLIASDIGVYDKDIVEFVNKLNIPYIRILIPRLFEGVELNVLPSEIDANCYYYLGNHDNDTIKTKLEGLNNEEKLKLRELVIEECKKLNVNYDTNRSYSPYEFAYKLIELIFASKANYITFTFQDLIFEGKNSRMNKPGSMLGVNWSFRFLSHQFNEETKRKLFELNKKYNRLNLKNF